MAVLLVVLTIIVLIVLDVLILRRIPRQEKAAPITSVPDMDLLLLSLKPERFALPAGLFFHTGHTWANVLFSGQVKVGIDDFLQRLLGRIDAVTLPPVNVKVREGQPFASIHQGRRIATLRAPLDGVVCAVNGELAKMPGLLKQDPYTRGWFVAVRPTNLSTDLARLRVGKDALAWLEAELARLEELLRTTLVLKREELVGATAADGGLVADGLLEHLDDEAWKTFEWEFIAAGAGQGEGKFHFV